MVVLAKFGAGLQEGAAIVKDCAAQLADLLTRAQRLRHRLTKRLLDSAEGQVQLGALEEEVGEIETDLRNAAPNAGSEAATVREARLTECAAIRTELKAARDEFTAALAFSSSFLARSMIFGCSPSADLAGG